MQQAVILVHRFFTSHCHCMMPRGRIEQKRTIPEWKCPVEKCDVLWVIEDADTYGCRGAFYMRCVRALLVVFLNQPIQPGLVQYRNAQCLGFG